MRYIFLKFLLRFPDEVIIHLGSKFQKGSMYVVIRSREVWKRENIKKQLSSILNLKWTPTENLLQSCAQEVFRKQILGEKSDYSYELFKLLIWHNSKLWELNAITLYICICLIHRNRIGTTTASFAYWLPTKVKNYSLISGIQILD